LEEVPRLDSQLREDLEALSRSTRVGGQEPMVESRVPELAAKGNGNTL
jgi:hypothetical protein